MADPLAAWDYDLPPELIASAPPEARDGGRLLVVGANLQDRRVLDLPTLLEADDLLVFNDVYVRKARLRARRQSGGAVEVLVLRASAGEGEALVRPARKLRVGERLVAGTGEILVKALHAEGRADVAFFPNLATIEEQVGELPLPPYFARAPVESDAQRYQTVFAARGALEAAAAPTAGLHFSPTLLAALRDRGVREARVTLEVGLGTFRPLTSVQLEAGELHPERFVVPEATWAAVDATRARGGRVVAVGTTVVRTLESATGPGEGETRIFLREGWRPRRVDALMTNFHLPRSSLLMLVAAFAGKERVWEAYAHAIRERYRFFSYGDACFFPHPRAR